MAMYAFLSGQETDENGTNKPPHPNASTNCHIFEALYSEKEKRWYIAQEKVSCCSSRITKKGSWVNNVFSVDELRIEAAKRQNSNKDICANCVQTFY